MTLTSEAPPRTPPRPHPVDSLGYVPFLVATAVFLAVVSVVAVWSGAASVSYGDVFAVLRARVGGPPVDPLLDRIVWGLRVPRVLIDCLRGYPTWHSSLWLLCQGHVLAISHWAQPQAVSLCPQAR